MRHLCSILIPKSREQGLGTLKAMVPRGMLCNNILGVNLKRRYNSLDETLESDLQCYCSTIPIFARRLRNTRVTLPNEVQPRSVR